MSTARGPIVGDGCLSLGPKWFDKCCEDKYKKGIADSGCMRQKRPPRTTRPPPRPRPPFRRPNNPGDNALFDPDQLDVASAGTGGYTLPSDAMVPVSTNVSKYVPATPKPKSTRPPATTTPVPRVQKTGTIPWTLVVSVSGVLVLVAGIAWYVSKKKPASKNSFGNNGGTGNYGY